MSDFKIISIQNNPESFQKGWKQFLANHKASPYYLPETLDYFCAYSAERLFADQSFVVLKGETPVACVFLPIEEIERVRTFTIGQSFAPAPLWEPQKNLLNVVMEEIDRLAREAKAAKAMFRVDLLQGETYPFNFLLNYDYLNASLLGYLVDCKEPSWRRNHERAIRKISSDSNFSVHIMDRENKDFAIHEQYRELHHKAAGRVTRSRESFDSQYRMLEAGSAILVGLREKDRFVAFTYFSFFQAGAISFSAADDPEYAQLPLYHIINSKALIYLQERGVWEMDMGQPLNTSNQLFCFPDAKQKNIALFKAGFSGRFADEFRGIKYFTREAFSQDQEIFSRKYQQAL